MITNPSRTFLTNRCWMLSKTLSASNEMIIFLSFQSFKISSLLTISSLNSYSLKITDESQNLFNTTADILAIYPYLPLHHLSSSDHFLYCKRIQHSYASLSVTCVFTQVLGHARVLVNNILYLKVFSHVP